jgi:hypothetical protein
MPGNEIADILAKQATGWRDKKGKGLTLNAKAIIKIE